MPSSSLARGCGRGFEFIRRTAVSWCGCASRIMELVSMNECSGVCSDCSSAAGTRAIFKAQVLGWPLYGRPLNGWAARLECVPSRGREAPFGLNYERQKNDQKSMYSAGGG